MNDLVRVVGFNLDGTATTEDGRTWSVVVNPAGSLGLVPRSLAGIDQVIEQPASWPPSIASLGIDQTG